MVSVMKTGYKQTEIGVIPENWEVSKVQHQANVIDSLHSTPSFSDDGYSMVRVTDIKTGNLSLNDALKVSKNVFDEFTRNYKPKRNDIVVSRVGSYGVSSFVETDEPFCMGQNTVVIDSKLPPRFLYYVLNSTSIKQQIEGESYGSGYKSLSLKNIKELSIPIPPKHEQTAIAAALSDVDALMGELDKLIAKKRDIKQATMQQLLTGKKRLAGFSGEWEVKKFKDVTDLITCGIAATPEYVNESNGVPFLSSTNVKNGQISWSNFKFISKELHNQLYKNNPPLKGDILYSRVGTIGEAAIVDADFEFSIYVSLTLIKTSVLNNEFLKQLLNSNTYKKLANNTVLMGGGVGNLNVNVVREFPISFPSIEEQTAIATILSDMDAEINALQQKRDKTAQLKQGMMQELLTGRIRLIPNDGGVSLDDLRL